MKDNDIEINVNSLVDDIAQYNETLDMYKQLETEDIELAYDLSKECLLFDNLNKFNKLCASGDFDKAMEFVIANNSKNFMGTASFAVSNVAVMLGLLLVIIPLIRELIFFFYYSRAKVSDYFDAQATLLTVNSYNIENNLTR